jgi:hypothetical protein
MGLDIDESGKDACLAGVSGLTNGTHNQQDLGRYKTWKYKKE